MSDYRTPADVLKLPGDSWVTGSGQVLVDVHDESRCSGGACVIHNPSDHNMRFLPTLWRNDRSIMERTCPHGVGHPDPDAPYPPDSLYWVHGCDGCCRLDHPEAAS